MNIKSLIRYAKNLKKYLKSGGVVYASISSIQDSSMFKNRNIMITGGGSGFGFRMAKDFIDKGACVVITGRNKQKLEEAKKNINSDRLKFLVWDMSLTETFSDKLSEAISLFGSIDVFINNAGVWNSINWQNTNEKNYDYIVDINTKGLFFICKIETEYMQDNKIRGKIINITSIEGLRSDFAPYSISKWGANCITKGLAKIAIKEGIIVNAVAPGVALTDINPNLKHSAADNYYFPTHLSGRFTAIQEVSNIVQFLASDLANNIVGQVITVDGGWTLN